MNSYRTMCIAPSPDFLLALEGISALRVTAPLRIPAKTCSHIPRLVTGVALKLQHDHRKQEDLTRSRPPVALTSALSVQSITSSAAFAFLPLTA